jgi:hypothetical protein
MIASASPRARTAALRHPGILVEQSGICVHHAV